MWRTSLKCMIGPEDPKGLSHRPFRSSRLTAPRAHSGALGGFEKPVGGPFELICSVKGPLKKLSNSF